MKKYTNIYAMVAVLMLLFASCSTEKIESPIDDSKSESLDLTFGAILNDLANRSMNKDHFNQVPDCSDAEPAFAVIGLSVDGVVQPNVTVAILSDSDGYFTAYSEALKILVPSGDSVTITLNSFMVYDGDPSLPASEIIWIAPKESVDGEFDGYVAKPLPFNFELEAGTKPYIDIEVLCFDRRMVNEYGYVFFDVVPKTIYPLCLFVNYCNEDGRHWVADYAIDLYFGTDANGIQLYSNSNPNAMATTGTGDGGYFAEPLCLVIPGPPANLDNDDPYLYLVIYPQDWGGTGNYGDIENTGVPVQLSWNMVNELLNDDGTTNEYLHLLVGECEDALDGDGTIPGGGGGNECDLNDPEANCDGDDLLNKCDPDNPNYSTFDCDGDDVLNGVDDCPQIFGEEQLDGCPDPCDFVIPICALQEPLGAGCKYAYYQGNPSLEFFAKVSEDGTFDITDTQGTDPPLGTFSAVLDGSNVILTLDGEFPDDVIRAYEVEVRINDGTQSAEISGCEREAICNENETSSKVDGDQPPIELIFDGYTYEFPFYVRVKVELCFEP